MQSKYFKPKDFFQSSSSSSYPLPTAQRTASSYQQLFTSKDTSSATNQSHSFVNQRYGENSRQYPWHESSRTPVQPLRRGPRFNPNYSLISEATSVDQSADTSSVVLCVTEGTGHSKGTVGMAAIDLYNPELELSQFTDNSNNYENLRNKIIALRPIIIIIPKTFVREDNRLFGIISTDFRDISIVDFDRKYFNDGEGEEMIRKLRCDDCYSVEIQLKSKYYCLSACSALLKYLESVENLIYSPKSLRVVVNSALNTMFIDPTTAKLLELIVNLDDPKSPHTVFGTINKTKTRSGYRLLRSSLLQPSTDIKLIESRHDMIEAIVGSQTLFEQLGGILMKFSGIEIERVITCLAQSPKNQEPNVKSAERKIECILILKHMLCLIDPMVETLSLCETKVFDDFKEVLSDQRFPLILAMINQYIEEDCKYSKGGLKMKLEKCSAIKRKINALLDIARDTYSESIDDIYHMINRLAEKYRESLTIKQVYNPGRGYHIETSFKDGTKRTQRFPNEFIKIVFKKKSINFTTQELINKNNRINSSVEEIYLMSDSVITILIEKIREFIGCLFNLAEVVSKVDLVYSFASQCALANYVRPKFDDYVAIQQSIHPVLEKVLNRKPVPNDIYLTEDNNFVVITGPNMSGKSILLKQMAILQVMAQIGSYIPAEFATFRICDKVFSRIGNNDEIETNSSTFMVEMREMSYILKNFSRNSLIIIDELGRGTSVEEGVGLCFAICEHLLKTKAFTLMATHFIELTKLENFYLNVSNYNFGVEHGSSELSGEEHVDSYRFKHVLEPGATKEVSYGLRLAEYTAMDPNVLAKAKEIADTLRETQRPTIFSERITEKQRIYYKLTSLLKIMIKDGIPDRETIQQMQNHFLNRLAAAEAGTQQENETTDQEMTESGNDFSLI